MNPRPRNTRKAGSKGTKPAIREDALLPVKPFPLAAFTTSRDGQGKHWLNEILTPKRMAASVLLVASPWAIFQATRKAVAALAGCGPSQERPHLWTHLVLSEGIDRLRDHALAGDKAAMRCLGSLLHKAVADLGEIARRKPEIVREWSRKQTVVPVLAGKNKGHRKQLEVDLAAFAVGEDSPFRVNPPPRKKAPDVSTGANALAGGLFSHLADCRASAGLHRKLVPTWARMAGVLPEFSRVTWERWAEAAWECLLASTKGHPEEHSFLRDLGRKGERKDGLGTPRTVAANVRAEIRQTLREAIRGLAR